MRVATYGDHCIFFRFKFTATFFASKLTTLNLGIYHSYSTAVWQWLPCQIQVPPPSPPPRTPGIVFHWEKTTARGTEGAGSLYGGGTLLSWIIFIIEKKASLHLFNYSGSRVSLCQINEFAVLYMWLCFKVVWICGYIGQC